MFVEPLKDLIEGFGCRDYWLTFALNDVRARYRRSRIGQFWITLSVALFVLGIGTVYSGIFGTPVEDYMPRVAVSYVTWVFLSAGLASGCYTFIAAAPTMQQRLFPLSVHAYRLVARELLVLAHNAVVVVVVWVIFGLGLDRLALFAIAGVFINAYVVFWLSIILGIVSVRYRDVPPIVQSLVNVLFFITPVLWTRERLGGTSDIVLGYNPFAYLIEIVRDPLLGISVPASVWTIALSICVVVTCVGLAAMAATRRRLSYWL